jgi:hypothetical protein
MVALVNSIPASDDVEPAPAQELLPQVAARLPLVYFNHGYESGYRQALGDVLSSLTEISEQFMSTRPETRDHLRRVLYPFEEFIQAHIARMTPDGFVEGGLGI